MMPIVRTILWNLQETYEGNVSQGREPENIDKEFLRRWYTQVRQESPDRGMGSNWRLTDERDGRRRKGHRERVRKRAIEGDGEGGIEKRRDPGRQAGRQAKSRPSARSEVGDSLTFFPWTHQMAMRGRTGGEAGREERGQEREARGGRTKRKALICSDAKFEVMLTCRVGDGLARDKSLLYPSKDEPEPR